MNSLGGFDKKGKQFDRPGKQVCLYFAVKTLDASFSSLGFLL